MDLARDVQYYRRREAQEREIAELALLPNVAKVHLEMADRYAALAGLTEAPARPRLTLARS